jgi:hypothetical protein
MPAFRVAASAAAIAWLALAGSSSSATTLWRTDWVDAAPLAWISGLNGDSPNDAGVAFLDDGDVVIAANGSYTLDDSFVMRFGADGALRWSGVAAAYEYPSQIVPLADGGAYATFGLYGMFGFAARFDTSGTTLWQRSVPAHALVPVDDARVAISDCESVSMLDAATGVVRWNRLLAHSSECYGGLIRDASTLYTIAAQDYPPAEGERLVAVDLDGDILWRSPLDVTGCALVGNAAGLVYLRTDEETLAYHAGDGSLAWRAPGSGWILAGATHEPIVVTVDGIQRLAADNGHVRWTTALGPYVGRVAAVGDSVVALVGGTLVRLDAETGAIAWIIDLPLVDSAGNPLREWSAIGDVGTDAAFAVIGRSPITAFVQRIDYATGALAAAAVAPPIPQAIDGNVLREGNDLVAVRTDYTRVLRAIDIDATTGAVRWNVATPFAVGVMDGGSFWWESAHAVGPSRIAVAIPINAWSQTGGVTDVVALDRASGAVAWETTLWDFDERETAVTTPIVDAAGNVIVSIAMTLRLFDGTYEQRQSIYKLAAADGAVLWRVDDDLFGETAPKAIFALGDDVLVEGPFADSTDTLRRLDGDDGSLQWASGLFADSGLSALYRDGDTRLIAFAAPAVAFYQWAALDAATGSVLWSTTAPCIDGANCGGVSGALSPDGRIIVPFFSTTSGALVALDDHGSGATHSWPLAPTADNLHATIDDVAVESDGTVDFAWGRYGPYVSGATWAARFDPSAGSASYQRIVGTPIGARDGTSLLIDQTTAFSREDMAITARGNLAASVALDEPRVAAGQHLGFHLIATWEGDAPLAGVSMRGSVRWPSGATDLSCGGIGVSNCVLDATGDAVYATFDIAPGGRVDVAGKILVLDSSSGDGSRSFGVRVAGPAGLDESDTIDNFARASTQQVLFADGFDG